MVKEKIARKLEGMARIVENPNLLRAKLSGLNIHFASNCLEMKTLLGEEPNTVLDIGAYQGTFAAAASYIFPKAKIYAFEPIRESCQEITNLQKKFPNITVVNSAVGKVNGKISFHKNNYLLSSSYKPMLERHKNEFPRTKHQSLTKVNSIRLDKFLQDEKPKRPIFVKMDVQGAELDALESASGYIEDIDAITLEISLVKLYEDAPTFNDVYSYLKTKGMNFVDIADKLRSHKNKKIVQFDAIFIRNYN